MSFVRKVTLDGPNRTILGALMADARTSLRTLADKVGLSAPAVRERIRQMEEAGVIQGYAADVSWAALGYGLQAIVRIEPLPGKLREVERTLQDMPQIVQCDGVTGDDCFIARVVLRDVADLDVVLDPLHVLARTSTAVIKKATIPLRAPPYPDS
ncbi:Lrp/AsnC family transcriptional regulator [Sandarakinorhabdus oryzae]|uniref:Lrp/AsnC family transcriptional regulator n=1 Tax=Sandarakinorhabdus oryzae TaxID=2675220 RepID=UPI0012E23651|nr:Lrp/AsnC family transcriptional regulator [Sandarakinorhabdus oryzae]